MLLEDLKKKIEGIGALVKSGAITKEKAESWKERIVIEFEKTYIPKAPEKELPNDLAHLPGRIVGKMIKGFGNMSDKMAQNAADRIAQIERERASGGSIGSPRREGRRSTRRNKNEEEDREILHLPEIYR